MGDKIYRLYILLDNICLDVLLKTFLRYKNSDSAYPNFTLDSYLQAKRCILLKKKMKKVIKQYQWDLLFPKSGNVDDKSWDITLFILLIETLFLGQLNSMEKNAIDDINSVRNDLKHTPYNSVSDMQFDRMWTSLEKAAITLAQQISQNPSFMSQIQELINDAKVNNMPKLGDALRANFQRIYADLMENMKDTLSCSKESLEILKDSSVLNVGPSGGTVKRIKTIDPIQRHLKDSFKSILRENIQADLKTQEEVNDIKNKLQVDHHVVVTGPRDSYHLKAALSAIKELSYNYDRCSEIRKASDWMHLDFDDVDLVLCINPFGDHNMNIKKAEDMSKVLNNMKEAVKPSDGKRNIDIVIVTDEGILKEFKSFYSNDILANEVRVCQPTSEKAPIDLTKGLNKVSEGEMSQCLNNLIEFSLVITDSYKNISTVSKTVVEDAKSKFKRHKAILITGPRKSGKTTLAVQLTLIYQKWEYVILNKVEDIKHISLNKVCLLVIEDFAGKYKYDANCARGWMREFDILYAAVMTGKLNVVITCDDKSLEKCKNEFEDHQIFGTIIQMNESDVSIKQEKDENLSTHVPKTSDMILDRQQTNKKRKLADMIITRPLVTSNRKIETYVFMHINTTSLPKSGECRITELCLLAVSRNFFSQYNGTSQPSIPRVSNKLSLCFQPDKHIISEATKVSKLTDELLTGQPQFTWLTGLEIKLFLMKLQQPFCFVAHNGNNFDFKVLNAELRRLNMEQFLSSASTTKSPHQRSGLDDLEAIIGDVTDMEFDQMLCADSLVYLRERTYFASYALRQLFQEKFGTPASNTHTAEGFCKSLLSVVKSFPTFPLWVDKNAKLMESIEPAY